MSDIYLDYAANTPGDNEVFKAFNDATVTYFANPNSTHRLGKLANERIENSTYHILDILRKNIAISDNMEIIYTSGSSESNNMAIKGVARSYRENGKHIITTFLEHTSVSSPLTNLKESGYEIDLLEVNSDGKINLEHLRELLRKDTILVSISSVDSELGTIQPIDKIAEILRDYPNCFLHVDCTQSIGKINMDLTHLNLKKPNLFF